MAADFSLPDQNSNLVRLSNLKGKWVVLYFYPKDQTPGCTIEAMDFTLLKPEFDKYNTVILGVSADSSQSHCKFIEKNNLDITLLSDPQRKAIEKYGAWHKINFFGKEIRTVKRSTFLISPDGNIAFSWPKVKPKGHAAEVLAKLKELS